MTVRNHKFMQTLDGDVYRFLLAIAEERGVTIQEFMRAVIIPEWIRLSRQEQTPPRPRISR